MDEITKDQFRLIMRLIALSQEGYPPSRKSIVNFGMISVSYIEIANKPVHFAELQGIPVFVPLNRSLHREALQSFHEQSQNGIISVLDILCTYPLGSNGHRFYEEQRSTKRVFETGIIIESC